MKTIDLAKKLISIDSVDSKPEILDFIEPLLHAKGVTIKRVKKNNVENLIAFKKEIGKKLLFNAHYDTIPAGDWKTDPFKPRVTGDRLYGLGSCDMKAGLAAEINAFLRLASQELSGSVYLAIVGDEELGSGKNGAQAVISHLPKPDFVVTGEPSDLKIIRGQKSLVELKIITKGKAIHVDRVEFGVNAIKKMFKLLNYLSSRFSTEDGLEDDRFYKKTMNIGMISGGHAANIVPDYCEAIVDFRLPPSLNVKSFIKDFELLAEQLDFTFTTQAVSQGFVEPKDAFLVKKSVDSLRELKVFPELLKESGASDARFFYELGSQVIDLGPGPESLAHCAEEFVSIRETLIAEEFYFNLGRKLLGEKHG
ncbi:M20 family metallopeptidase [Candidatus Micrarchaeota archaeon]|nr:M20 family metallopeptidase [Candidatus Micrarchaeota archaeon]